MAEDELLRPVFREVHRQRPSAFIRQMAVIGCDPALEIDRVRPGAQQLRVVVGLNDGAVHAAQRRAHGIRHGAEVSAETEARRPVEPVAAAPGRVMRRGKRCHAHIAEAKRLARRDLVQAVRPLGQQFSQRSAHRRQRIHRRGVAPQQNGQALDMVGVLVRHEYAREVGRRNILRSESRADAPCGDAGVDQNMCLAVGHERAVTARPAGKQRDVHSAATAAHCSAPSRSSTMSAPTPRSLPTKFS